MALPPVVALEIGTSKVTALVGELREGGHLMITGMGKNQSSGVRKGEIVDLENAAVSAKTALQAAEESSGVMIRQVHLAISGGHIQPVINRGTVPVLDAHGEIGEEDVEQVMQVAKAVNLPPDRDVLHTICQHFCIDEHERVTKPEGMEGATLSLDMLILHGVRTVLRNTVRVVRSLPLDVQDVAFSGLCSALAVLTPEQKKSGAVVIDLGGGTTDFLVYAQNVVATAGTFGVGGDHVTNDIAQAFSIPGSQAERLKKEHGTAIPEPSLVNSPRICLPAEVGFPGRKVSVHALHTVIHARLEETFQLIRHQIGNDVLHHVGAGILLTGGGAHLRGAAALAEQIFGLPCEIGKPRAVSGLATATEGPEYAAAIGMVHYGFKTMNGASQSGIGITRWLRTLLGR